LLKEINYWSEAPVWDEESISVATNKWFEYLG
jgi:UDP-glucose 4-epimerase